MGVTNRFWEEIGRAEVSEMRAGVIRFIKERCAENINLSVDLFEQDLAAIRSSTVEPLTFLQIGDFMESVGEPPAMFAEGIIPDKSLLLWSGRAKVGKSLAAYQMMEDIAAGRPLFGRFHIPHGGPVLYIGMEDGKHEINRRLRLRGNDPANKDFPIYVSTDHRDYGQEENVQALRAYIATMETPPVFIVIDTVTESFDCVRDWNDRNAVKRAMRALRAFAQDVCTVLAIIHNTKGSAEDKESGDEIAGTLAVVSSVDGYLSCYKRRILPNGNLQLFVRGGGRGGIVPKEFIIEMDTNDYHWRWLDPEEADQAKHEEAMATRRKNYEKIERAFLAFPKKEGTAADVSAHISMSVAYTRTLIKEMLEENLLRDTGKTQPNSKGAGKPAPIYTICQNNNNDNNDSSYRAVVIIQDGIDPLSALHMDDPIGDEEDEEEV